jgi:hypothetical protein
MKKKIDCDHYVTDALVTSEDEWDSFDYNIRTQIKDLGKIDYDSQSSDWKKNTVAFAYLHYLEKLLLEKEQWVNHEIEDIREIQTLIERYDHLKTFLLTLRIAMIGFKNGHIPRLITEGEAHFEYRNAQSLKRGKRRIYGNKTLTEIEARNNQIVQDFKKTLQKNPNLTPSGFSKKHAVDYKLKPSMVQKIIKKAVSNLPG